MSEILPIATGRQTRAWLWSELRTRRGEVAGTLLAGILAAAAAIVPVYALGLLVDRVRADAGTSAIVSISIVIVTAALVGGAAIGLSTYLIGRLGSRMLADLRESTVATALRLPALVLDRAGRGDLLSRVGADIAAIGKAVSDVLPNVISALLLGVLSLVAMAGIDWRLGLAGAVTVPFYAIALRWYLPRSAPRYAEERKAVAERSQLLVESMQGLRTVHAYRLEDRHLAAIDRASAKARDIDVGVFTLFTRFVGRINRAEFVGLAVLLATGFWLVRNGSVSVGQASAAALLFHRLFNPVSMLLFTFDEIQSAGASLSRLVGVETMPVERRTEGHRPADSSLTLDDVSFSYDGRTPVLQRVSLRLEPGERVALVGSTGAGKTTVASIAAGLLRPDEGSARVGGVPVHELPPETVAIISQETHVFAGPLIEDLRLARPGTAVAAVEAALETVGALQWAQALPEGLDTLVGDGGHDLTPAQAQQLALARLVLLDPAVAVLDEATAEAGSAGARALEEAAAAATRGRTVLIVAHRLTQAASADRVVVLEHGAVVESGPHADLVAAGGRYAELWTAWESRATKERVA
ncbi:ABC transporter ATP-binding protein [Actinoplanes friuliensis]|uniref:Putative ABC transporter ATPase and permease protein n=1 Tax=Actinoplanes friuliensis DSM 7358 TaxID=1246995 RepID=U5VVW5_9ACTN|nr:ABC transporter ATP-binding protein [Actinoplanes friuliensis]AGZ39865.1 putative ABC transporter ATPase and permease protein [Actinoplanes friuliensis DSM 7358]